MIVVDASAILEILLRTDQAATISERLITRDARLAGVPGSRALVEVL